MAKLPLYDDPLVQEIETRIKEKMNKIKDELVANGAADFAAYRHKAGQHEGLKQALFCVHDAIKNYERADDL